MAEANEEKEAKQEPPKAAAAAASAPPSKLMPALLVMNTLLLAGVLAALVLRPGAGKAVEAKAEKPAAAKEVKDPLPGPTVHIGDFIVHLRDTEADRFARVAFDVEVADEKAKDAVNARIPQIRDAFLSYLTDRSSADFQGSEALGRVKSALADKLKEVVPGATVHALFLTELVIQ